MGYKATRRTWTAIASSEVVKMGCTELADAAIDWDDTQQLHSSASLRPRLYLWSKSK